MNCLATLTFKFKNWDKYNKRQKDIKRPFWFALSNSFFSDPDLYKYSDSERLTLIFLLCQASEFNRYGECMVEERSFSRITGFDSSVLLSTIDKLLKSKAAADLRQDGGESAAEILPAQNRTEHNKKERMGQTKVCPESAHDGRAEEIYKSYPKRKGNTRKASGLSSLTKLLLAEGNHQKILAAVKNYSEHCKSEKIIGTPLVSQFATFFGKEKLWEEWADKEVKSAPQVISNFKREY